MLKSKKILFPHRYFFSICDLADFLRVEIRKFGSLQDYSNYLKEKKDAN